MTRLPSTAGRRIVQPSIRRPSPDMILAFAMAAALAVPPSPGTAGTDTADLKDATAQIVPGKKNSRDNDVVCRTSEDTGTRLGTNRRCMTRAEWQLRDAQYKQEIGTALKDLRGPNNH